MLSSPQYKLVQPGESLAISLLARDQVNNSREAVWSLEAPNQDVVSVLMHVRTCMGSVLMHVGSCVLAINICDY